MKKKTYRCTHCDEEIQTSARIFCSTAHQHEHARTARIAAWLSGEFSGTVPNGNLSKTIRDYLIRSSDDKCSRCGWGEPNPIVGKPILTIDHIDGDWLNNTPNNLRVLCFNCHSLTPTFGSLNRGRGLGRPEHNRTIDGYVYKRAGASYSDAYARDESRPLPTRRLKDQCECGKPKMVISERCRTCTNKHRHRMKIDWPSPQELLDMLDGSSYTDIARQLGVTDNAIRKHLRRRGIAPPKRQKKGNE